MTAKKQEKRKDGSDLNFSSLYVEPDLTANSASQGKVLFLVYHIQTIPEPVDLMEIDESLCIFKKRSSYLSELSRNTV